MKIINNILHGIRRVGNRFESTNELIRYRGVCAEEVRNEYNGYYDDGPDLENVGYWHTEMDQVDKELARRERR